ncbi:MAG: hypothetical protein AB7S26_35825 [Sandaracinaceae bacterium]
MTALLTARDHACHAMGEARPARRVAQAPGGPSRAEEERAGARAEEVTPRAAIGRGARES